MIIMTVNMSIIIDYNIIYDETIVCIVLIMGVGFMNEV